MLSILESAFGSGKGKPQLILSLILKSAEMIGF